MDLGGVDKNEIGKNMQALINKGDNFLGNIIFRIYPRKLSPLLAKDWAKAQVTF